MKRKKLVIKFGIVALVVFVISLSIAVQGRGYRNKLREKKEVILNTHVLELTNTYRKFLRENVVAKIQSLEVSPELLNDIEFDFLQKKMKTRLYMWITDPEGKVLTGIPSATFRVYQRFYDKSQKMIDFNRHYANYDEFIQAHIAQFGARNAKLKSLDEEFLLQKAMGGDYKIYSRYYYLRSPVTTMEMPIFNENSEMIGKVGLVIDDYGNHNLYKSLRRSETFMLQTGFPMAIAFLVISIIFIWFLLPTWVYLDASSRGVSNVFALVFLSVIGFVFGLIIYLIVRPAKTMDSLCPECDKELNGTRAFCPYCGIDLSGNFCSSCQYPIESGWGFCPSCRTTLKDQSAPPMKEEK